MIRLAKTIVGLLLAFTSYSQTPDNPELKKMYEEDQAGRLAQPINWAQLSKGDSLRELRVYEYLKLGRVVTGRDHYHVAMIFQHGRDTVASSMAVKMMRKAIVLDSTVNRWLLAAAIDRNLMRRNEPQIYGTQYVRDLGNSKWERYKIDSTQVTDKDRAYYKVETLAEQKIKEHSLNVPSILELYAKNNSVPETIKRTKEEKKKGLKSEYNVSENEVNTWGYTLLKDKKMEDALAVFKLNTELYPMAFNTFDSLGECLFMLKRKDEGVKAYKRSLELNPGNQHAMKAIAESK